MVDRVHQISGEDFRRNYFDTRTPVVITGMMDTWPALQWGQDYLTRACRDQTVEVMGDRDSDDLFELHCESHRRIVPFAEFAALAYSDVESNNTYLVANNKFMSTSSGQRLLRDVRALPYLTPNPTPDRVFFWFGPAGTVTSLHHDVLDIMLTQVRGRKFIRLYGPQQTQYLYNSIGVYSDVDPERPDLTKYPLYRQTDADLLNLDAGEMLFIPNGHWHHVRSLTGATSVSFTNFPA